MLDSVAVGTVFSSVTRLAVTTTQPSSGVAEVRPANVDAEAQFTVRASLTKRRLEVDFTPGTMAGALVRRMGLVDEAGHLLWGAQVERLRAAGCAISMDVNSAPVDVAKPDQWPEPWRFLSVRMSRNLVAIEPADLDDGLLPAEEWVGRFAALMLALLPLTEVEGEDVQFEPEVEGDRRLVAHFRTERSPRNRAAAIAMHGTDCKACGTGLERVYGSIARDLVHVHHVTPLSELDGPTIVDPARDLVPLCPNCHSVAHRRRPPYTVEELRSALASK